MGENRDDAKARASGQGYSRAARTAWSNVGRRCLASPAHGELAVYLCPASVALPVRKRGSRDFVCGDQLSGGRDVLRAEHADNRIESRNRNLRDELSVPVPHVGADSCSSQEAVDQSHLGRVRINVDFKHVGGCGGSVAERLHQPGEVIFGRAARVAPETLKLVALRIEEDDGRE